MIHGHRGARGLRPENTIAGIRAGIDAGCDAIEVDLCVTRDDHLVLVHDPVLSPNIVRDQAGNWIEEPLRVRQLDLEQVQGLDVGMIRPGSFYALRYPEQKSVAGAGIPTLDEFSAFMRDNGTDILVNLELKSTPYDPTATPDVDHYAQLVVDGLQQLRQTHEVVIQSFDWRLPTAVRGLDPDIQTGFTTDCQPDADPLSPVSGMPAPWTCFRDLAAWNDDLPLMIHSMGADIWSSNLRDLTEDRIQHARELGLQVYAWTVNRIEDMELAVQWDVDAITTDYPDRLYSCLQEHEAINHSLDL